MITWDLYGILGDIFKMNTNTNTPRVLNMPIKKKNANQYNANLRK